MRLAELSETQLVFHLRGSFLRGKCTMISIGDDCAWAAAPEGSSTVAVDIMVEGQHFHLSQSTGYEVDARAAAQNLVDIDTMGGRPSALVASVVAPCDMDLDAFLDAVRGLGDRACEVGAGVIGGNLNAGEKLVISITAFDYCPGLIVRHDDARPGDVVAISGTLGYSYAGLDLPEGGYVDPSSRGVEQPGELTPFIETYRVSGPPLSFGVAAMAANACAMMDLSDGPATDAGRIAQDSGVAVEFNQDAIGVKASQLAPATRVCAVDPVRWVLQGGEGHGMIAVLPPDALLPDSFCAVGGV